MKKNKDIQTPKEEDNAARKKRRENYALSRDMLASDFNEAIAKRKDLKDRNLVKCEKCGKEFEAGTTTEDSRLCPDCQ
jgi:hypothetical protein